MGNSRSFASRLRVIAKALAEGSANSKDRAVMALYAAADEIERLAKSLKAEQGARDEG